MDLCEFMASLISIVNSRTARTGETLTQKKEKKKKNRNLNCSSPRKAVANSMKLYTHVIKVLATS